MNTTATRNVWLASWLLSNDLPFLRAVALPGRRSHIATFVFGDPDARAASLEREFHDHRGVQRLVIARRVMSEILDVVAARAWCAPEDVAESLRSLPSSRRP